MQHEHIEGPDNDGVGLVEIMCSKTVQEGQGALAYLSPVTMQAIGDRCVSFSCRLDNRTRQHA